MKDELCRRCGKKLKSIKNCPICKNPIKFQCNKCNTITDEEIHLNCKPSKVVEKITK